MSELQYPACRDAGFPSWIACAMVGARIGSTISGGIEVAQVSINAWRWRRKKEMDGNIVKTSSKHRQIGPEALRSKLSHR